MSVLLLRLKGPMMAFGKECYFDNRYTEIYPTKSAVTGMIACALGRGRDDDISDIAALRFGVRADRPGEIIEDIQTAQMKTDRFSRELGKSRETRDLCGGYTEDLEIGNLSHREYIVDAAFLVGLESDDLELLGKIAWAIEYPEFHIYLGRKNCVPEYPVLLRTREHEYGITDKPLYEALFDEPYVGGEKDLERRLEKEDVVMEIMTEGSMNEKGRRVKDFPLSFSIMKRQYTYRKVIDCVPKIIAGSRPEKQGYDVFSEATEIQEQEHDVFTAAEKAAMEAQK